MSNDGEAPRKDSDYFYHGSSYTDVTIGTLDAATAHELCSTCAISMLMRRKLKQIFTVFAN